MTRKPLMECRECGLPLHRNDEAVRWLGPTWDDRDPYCVDCAPLIERRLLAQGV